MADPGRTGPEIRPLAGPGRGTGASRRRHGLAFRIALVTTAVALVAVGVTGLIFLGLVRGTATGQARDVLGREAELFAQAYDRPRVLAALRRPGVNQLLKTQQITLVHLDAAGTVRTTKISGQQTLTLPAGVAGTLAGGHDVNEVAHDGGRSVLVAGRTLESGGALVLLQPSSEARGLFAAVARRLGIGVLVGLAVAGVGGVALAWRLARPLAEAAGVAHELAGGRRDVRLTPRGPAEVAEVGEALNALAGALTVSEGRQREFLLSVSHELRTPLTAIRGFAEALADGVTPTDEVAPTGRVVVDEAERLERLVSDLLDLARLGAEDFRVDLAPVDLTALLLAAGEVWKPRCAAEGIPFSLDVPPYPVVIVSDGGRIRQIVDGLAENALRVVPPGAPIVFALARAADPYVAVQVRDGGPGLTTDDCAVAFDRSALYERYRGIRRVGTGVGLALVAGLARRLGGRAEAGRAPEGGAAFTVLLPRDGGTSA